MATPMALLEPVDSTDPQRLNIRTPFRMEYEGRRWLCATEGHIAAAIPFDGEARKDGPEMARMIPGERPSHGAPIAALREWAGPVLPPKQTCATCKGVPPEECERCDGEGVVQEFCDCPNCDGEHDCPECNGSTPRCTACGGDGETRTPPRYARLLNGALDLNMLARLLLTAPADGLVRLQQCDELSPYLLRMDDWIGLVMPCRGVPTNATPFAAEPLP